MANRVAVTLNITANSQNNKKQETNVTAINPNATNADLKAFAVKLINLTGSTFTGAYKVTKEDISNG